MVSDSLSWTLLVRLAGIGVVSQLHIKAVHAGVKVATDTTHLANKVVRLWHDDPHRLDAVPQNLHAIATHH